MSSVMGGAGGVAGAEPPSDAERFAWHEQDFNVEKPAPGVDVAKIAGRPAWCDGVKIKDRWEPDRISRTVGEKYGIDGTQDGALQICQRPDDPTWRTEATYILQKWMNSTGMTQPEAEADLRIRINRDRLPAQKTALCKGLEVPAEAGGQDLAFAKARISFFGCDQNADAPLWANDSTTLDDTVGFYLDDAVAPDTELMRLAWLLTTVQKPRQDLPSKDARENRGMLYYAMASYDMEHIDLAALDKELAGAPYNDYARAIAHETAAMLRLWRKQYETAIDKLAKSDASYARILREAPKKGFAEWDALYSAWKPEIERSNAFEKKLGLPSRSARKGCFRELQKDAAKLVKSYKLTEYNPLLNKVKSDPVAGMLLSRLALCAAYDEIGELPGALIPLVDSSRQLRGPRSLAYYAIVDALVEVAKDRPHILLSIDGFWNREGSLVRMYQDDLIKNTPVDSLTPIDAEQIAAKGIVKSVTKVRDGVKIEFKKVTVRFPITDCVSDVHHPLQIDGNGNILYQQNCRATGQMGSQDETPEPLTLAPELVAGVKPGMYIAVGGIQHGGGVVLFTQNKPTDKKILTFLGFPL